MQVPDFCLYTGPTGGRILRVLRGLHAMQIIQQSAFGKPTFPLFKNEPLVIHRCPGGGKRALVIFVHGLGGSRYTTWGEFPTFLFRDFATQDPLALDLGFYEYRTALGRLRITRSIKLQTEAAVLADILRDFGDYQKIFFVVHSLGGILVKAAIANLVLRRDQKAGAALNKIDALIMMATPQDGSLWVPPFLSWITEDTRALAPHGSLLTGIAATFNEHIVSRTKDYRSDRILIPTSMVKAAEDMWVDAFSAGLGLNSEQQKLVRGYHTEIVKPTHSGSDAYVWVRGRIQEGLSLDRARLVDESSCSSVDGCIDRLTRDVGKLYEELWQAYVPALQADQPGGIEAPKAVALLEPIDQFARSGPIRRSLLDALGQLRVLLQADVSTQALELSVGRFLDEVTRYHCFRDSVFDELRAQGRVGDALRQEVLGWSNGVKRRSEDVIGTAAQIRASRQLDSAFTKEKEAELANHISVLLGAGEQMLGHLSFTRGRGDGRSELVGRLTEARQITLTLPGRLDSYKSELVKTIGLDLSEGDVYAKCKTVYEIMKRLLSKLRR